MKKILILLSFSLILWANESFLDELESIYEIKAKIYKIDEKLDASLINKNYNNYLEFVYFSSELDKISAQLKRAKRWQKEGLENKAIWLENKLNVLKEFANFSILKSLHLPQAPLQTQKISNIYLVLEGLSEKKTLLTELRDYERKLNDFSQLVSDLESKNYLLNKLIDFEPSKRTNDEINALKKQLSDYKSALENVSSAYEIFKSKTESSVQNIDKQISRQYHLTATYALIVLCIFIFRYLLGQLIRNYVDDKDKVYTSQKILNIFTFVIITLFSTFYFVENIGYLVSVLGFASAGLAIAMKDMFMSILGWMVLQFGGGFHVGDRIKVSKNGNEYVGDIIDISLLRMTVYEDITLTTYELNRRAGRLFYVPNNYIFTELISNYNYSHMKTVWDGIDINLEFNSNIEKAKQIILEAASAKSQAYSESAKIAIQKMRNHYQMKNSGTDAKIYVLITDYGVRLSVWYMANSREALKMRSIVSEEILRRIKNESDIRLAFPSQTLYLDKRANQPFNPKEIQGEL